MYVRGAELLLHAGTPSTNPWGSSLLCTRQTTWQTAEVARTCGLAVQLMKAKKGKTTQGYSTAQWPKGSVEAKPWSQMHRDGSHRIGFMATYLGRVTPDTCGITNTLACTSNPNV